MPESTYPNCFGPYLRYGIQTEFAHFAMAGHQPLSSRLLALLVQLKNAISKADFHKLFQENAGPLLPQYVMENARPGSRYIVLYVPPGAVDGTGYPPAWWDLVCDHIELSLPVKPQRLDDGMPFFKRDRPQCQNSLLMGVIDDGCPFASSAFHHRDGATGTRVLAIWDQNDRSVVAVPGSENVFGRALPDLHYGVEFWRDSVAAAGDDPRLLGMNDWVGLHTGSGGVDEQGSYRNAGFASLENQVAHGAHVMDLMAGNMPAASRMGPIGPTVDRRDPPSWKQGGALATPTDPAGDADIVFVQIPQAAVDDATGNWLGAHVIAGLKYIMSCAEPGVTDNVIVNISYGPTTGPHDGSSLLEKALADMVGHYDGTAGRPKLDIVLASGNAYDSASHVAYPAQPGSSSSWRWRIPPDNTVPCFAEVWMTLNDAAHATVTLVAPSGSLADVATRVTQAIGNNQVWLFAVPPTIALPRGGSPAAGATYAPAVHGEWAVQVDIAAAAPHAVEVSAFAARTDPNMQARTGARASTFVDGAWEMTHAASAAHSKHDGELSTPGSRIDRTGTLNGMATAQEAGLHIVGGYKVSDGRKSPYASVGPTRSGAAGRQGPDLALPCDESDVLRGILAGGTRTGSVFRMIGTSTAAPQWARFLSRQLVAPQTIPPPDNPGGLVEPTRRGAGNYPAP